MSESKRIIVFDGVCRLCDASLKFVERRDRRDVFRYVPFQSEQGSLICAHYSVDPGALDSFILIEQGRMFKKSSAWARILRRLPQPWGLLGSLLGVVPVWIRDPVYDYVGRHRYQWFGRFDTCIWPRGEDAKLLTPDEVATLLAGTTRDGSP